MQFQVVYADPPWKFTNQKTGGSHTSGAAQKYPTMDLGAIQALPVGPIATSRAVLALWVPTRLKFSHGYPTAIAWGFPDYQTTAYWDKQRLGLGFWLRNMVEELLFFTRGDVAPFRCQDGNIKGIPPGEHSEKPDEFRRLVENATRQFNRRRCVELFARKAVSGWTSAGRGVTGRDIRDDLRRLYAADVDRIADWPNVA